MDQGLLRNKRLVLAAVVGVALLAYLVYATLATAGKTLVTVEVIPEDATVTMNSEPISPGALRLTPGEYTFEASKEGFEAETQTVTVTDEEVEVGLLPRAVSDEAKAWLADNPEIQLRREAIGGRNANQEGLALEEETPLINQLPYDSILRFDGQYGPFSIDYGPSPDRENGVFIIVSNSSPNGRENALAWIRQQGSNPTDLEIRFQDFENPLVDGGQQ